MTEANIYLLFKGECREAFEFYRSVLGGEFESISTFGEMPPMEGSPSLSDEAKKQIMHVSLRVNGEFLLMGSDNGGETGPPVHSGNNFAIFLNTGSVGEVDRIFQAMSEGGDVIMTAGKTFWDAYFCQFTDKFGVNWMVSCPVKSA
jgi:PhnB protein